LIRVDDGDMMMRRRMRGILMGIVPMIDYEHLA
jgi:hypothetical protein